MIFKIYRAYLLVMILLYLTHPSFSQEEKKIVPDGTTGLLLEVGPEDYLIKKKPPNEFEGTYSTIRIGPGYILDGAAYSQNAVFKQQMDSAGLDVNSKFETRDFRLMVSGVSKIRRTCHGRLVSCMMAIKRCSCCVKPVSPLECLRPLDT
jgi:hypothetical protein